MASDDTTQPWLEVSRDPRRRHPDSTKSTDTVQNASTTMLRQRLLNEIKEIKQKPYPGIELNINESDLTKACLILTPSGEPSLHLTVFFPAKYPLHPPKIRMDSDVVHPNVFNTYICSSLLEETKGYSPAYTLKGIAIQMLSFFASDHVEQEEGSNVNLKSWKEMVEGLLEDLPADLPGRARTHGVMCPKCGFGEPTELAKSPDATAKSDAMDEKGTEMEELSELLPTPLHTSDKGEDEKEPKEKEAWRELKDLPAELLLAVCDHLETEDLLLAAQAWNGFGRVLRSHNIIRTRELQCFVLKEGFKVLDLGIGVNVKSRMIESEFDIISRQACQDLTVSKSVHGLRFDLWLPLPITENHWKRVHGQVDDHLSGVARKAGINGPLDTVVYGFMNDIVVRLSKDAEAGGYRRPASDGGPELKSTLTHASEKAVESYFHLFHLLLCLATERPDIVTNAERLVYDFASGIRDKQRVPNLGWLLIAILLTDMDVSEELTRSIILEAITRNVVFMLTNSNPELSFMETSEVSMYRLQKTFEANKTGYRLLMFGNLMRQVVRRTCTKTGIIEIDGQEVETKHKMTLPELRDDMFARHGAPPPGAAAFIAEKVREILKVERFDGFLTNMGVGIPSMENFTTMLRGTVSESMKRGLSVPALRQEEALFLRLEQEGPNVGRPAGMRAEQPRVYSKTVKLDFFPKRGGQGGGGRGGRGGRGTGRGR